MPEKLYYIEDPDYSEFVYNCMATSSAEDRRDLTPFELSFFKTKGKMRAFADYESKERRDLMLAKIGIQHCTIYAPKRTRVEHILDEVFTQYTYVEKRIAITQKMNAGKIFVQSTNDIIVGMHMAAQNSHSQVYVLNYSYVKMHQHLAEWKSSTRSEIKSAMETFDIISKLALAVLVSGDIVEGICGVNERELKVLLVLYGNRNTFTKFSTVAMHIGDTERMKGVQHICHELEQQEYIVREPGYDAKTHRKKQTYMIVSKGINAVMNYMKYLHKKTFQ